MKKPTLWQRFKHLFGRHRFGYVARLSEDSHMLACTICNKRFAMNTSVKTILEWDQELEDMYAMFDSLEKKDPNSLEKIHEFKRKYKRD